jgi:hypothetical protein
MKIEKAQNVDAKDLTELTINSKSYWGYSIRPNHSMERL